MTVPVSLLLPALALLLPVAMAACGGKEARIERERQALAQADAELLGPEVFDLVDQMAGYQSSHGERPPRSLRAMGIDSLTPTTARWIRTRGGKPTITVAFRRPAGHAVSRCRGTSEALEQLALEGAYVLECILTDGIQREFRIGPASP